MASLAGKTLGKYRLIEQLGKGGFASVYKAYQPRLDRYVALKVLHPHLVEGEDFLARFEREARSVAALRHPNIIMVHDFDVDDNTYYMVMEYVDGLSLKEKLAALNTADKRMPFSDIRRVIQHVCSALDYAHSQGMLHRDIKPSNVLLNQSGDAFLTDFGIARILSNTQFTATGALIGTPAYMSPEQGQGISVSPVSDVYSIGILLYELLVGHVPFEADTPLAVIFKHIRDPLPAVHTLREDLPEGIDLLIYKALAKDPEDRYQSPGELYRALQAVLPDESELETAVQIPVMEEKRDPVEAKVAEEEMQMTEEPVAEPEVTVETIEESIPATEVLETDEATVLVDEQDTGVPIEETVVSEEPIQPDTDDTVVEERPKATPVKSVKEEKVQIRRSKPLRIAGFTLIGILILAGLGMLLFRVILPGLSSAMEAGQTVSTATPTGTQDPRAFDDLGRMFFDEGMTALDQQDYAGAIAKFEQAIEAGFQDAEVYAQLGWACHEYQFYEQGCSFEQAVQFYSQAIERDPNQAWIYANRSWSYLHMEKLEAALNDARQASELEPDNPHHWNSIADIHNRMQEYDLALEAINQAIAMDPKNPEFFTTRAWIYSDMGDPDAAIQEWTYAIELDPENPDYWHERALRKEDKGDNAGALEDFNRVIELDPEKAWAYMGRAWAYARMGNPDEAVSNMDRAAVLDPENPWIFIVRARLFWWEMEDFEAALEAFNRAIELEPSNWEAHVNRGELYYYHLGEPGLALEDFNLAVDYAPDWTDNPFFARAMYYMDTGQWLNAINDLTEVIRRSPEGPDGYGHRGSAYRQLGQYDQARADYEMFLELSQDMPQYNDWRREISDWLATNP